MPHRRCCVLAFAAAVLTLAGISPCAYAQTHTQTTLKPAELDPARGATAKLESATHKPLAEQYIWTADDRVTQQTVAQHPKRDEQVEPHYFRRSFELASVPARATLYLAGPRSAKVFVNGTPAGKFEANPDAPIGRHVFAMEVQGQLHKGKNTIAIEAVRGIPVNYSTNSPVVVQGGLGKVLVVKLVGAARGVDGDALLLSDDKWKASMTGGGNWQQAGFDDSAWKAADSLGGIESSIELFQWNADAGMYDWPGYDGISPFLAQVPVKPASVDHVYSGAGALENADALKGAGGSEFRVNLAGGLVEGESAPHVLLDFGREVSGRLHFVSDSDSPATVTVQYGESETEAMQGPYLGVNPLVIGAHSSGYGPKSAFRYALIRFVGGKDLRFKSINADTIYYPVEYKGSFESSDAKLNLMWAIGAYTAHLCMQDDIWDAPKRDRGRWMGDLDVSGRTINDTFADHFLMEHTLDSLMGPAPVKDHVNFIAGYSAAWITGEAEYYRHNGSKEQLTAFHERLVQLMHFMESELDEKNLYANKTKSWPFVDWSPEFHGDMPEARRATQMEFYGAFEQGVWLLKELGDEESARSFAAKAETMKAAAKEHLLDASTHSYGTRWQTNAAAVLSGVAEPADYDALWKASLATVGKVPYNALIITPYYNYYVISAMAKMNHRAEALDWIRQYWGGMVDEGATSFWEGYDPSWYKDNVHAALQADNNSGYFVSLAHGWSSGVTPWLMEEVLGIKATGPGFSTVEIRPDLIDLEWAKGGEPTPRGMLNVSLKKAGSGLAVSVDVPAGTEAHVSVPVSASGGKVQVNGKAMEAAPAEDGKRAVVVLKDAGHFEIAAE